MQNYKTSTTECRLPAPAEPPSCPLVEHVFIRGREMATSKPQRELMQRNRDLQALPR